MRCRVRFTGRGGRIQTEGGGGGATPAPPPSSVWMRARSTPVGTTAIAARVCARAAIAVVVRWTAATRSYFEAALFRSGFGIALRRTRLELPYVHHNVPAFVGVHRVAVGRHVDPAVANVAVDITVGQVLAHSRH